MPYNSGNQKLNGLNPLAYIGVDAGQPSNFVSNSRRPTPTDSRNFQLGAFWLFVDRTVSPAVQEMYVLVSLDNAVAKWVLFTTGSGDLVKLTGDNAGTAVPDGSGNINTFGGTSTGGVATNINTSGSGNTMSINLNNSISQPNTNSSGTEGMYSLGGDRFLHNFGTNNTFLGSLSGNLTTTGTGSNTGIGVSALASLTTSAANVCIGNASGLDITSGNGSNTALGFSSLGGITTGSNNIAIGYYAALDYASNESSNIVIGNDGVLGESNVMRLGTSGSGTGQVNNTYIAGINGVNVGSSVATVVSISGDHLGSATITAGTGISVTPTANTITIANTGVSSAIVTTISNPGSGNFTFNASTKSVEIYGWSGGGGGGSGRRGSSTASGGGAGGAAGPSFVYSSPVSGFTSPVPYTVGAGGTGGVGVTTDNTDGNMGGNGTATVFGNISAAAQTAIGGPGGVNGSSSGANSTITIASTQYSYGGAASGSLISPANAQSVIFNSSSASGGGGGGGADSGTARSGSNGGTINRADGTVVVPGGTGGIETGTINGSSGTNASGTYNFFSGGTGGGGGGGQSRGPEGGNGGDGGYPGGGGGGGGGTLNGATSGSGGNGANGQLIIIEYR